MLFRTSVTLAPEQCIWAGEHATQFPGHVTLLPVQIISAIVSPTVAAKTIWNDNKTRENSASDATRVVSRARGISDRSDGRKTAGRQPSAARSSPEPIPWETWKREVFRDGLPTLFRCVMRPLTRYELFSLVCTVFCRRSSPNTRLSVTQTNVTTTTVIVSVETAEKSLSCFVFLSSSTSKSYSFTIKILSGVRNRFLNINIL